MDMREYQRLAARTMPSSRDPDLDLAVWALGLAGEAGEVVELIKKHVGHGHTLDKTMVAKELGDVLWYVAAVATHQGLDLGAIADANIEKLRKRYPKGFSESASRERAE